MFAVVGLAATGAWTPPPGWDAAALQPPARHPCIRSGDGRGASKEAGRVACRLVRAGCPVGGAGGAGRAPRLAPPAAALGLAWPSLGREVAEPCPSHPTQPNPLPCPRPRRFPRRFWTSCCPRGCGDAGCWSTAPWTSPRRSCQPCTSCIKISLRRRGTGSGPNISRGEEQGHLDNGSAAGQCRNAFFACCAAGVVGVGVCVGVGGGWGRGEGRRGCSVNALQDKFHQALQGAFGRRGGQAHQRRQRCVALPPGQLQRPAGHRGWHHSNLGIRACRRVSPHDNASHTPARATRRKIPLALWRNPCE